MINVLGIIIAILLAIVINFLTDVFKPKPSKKKFWVLLLFVLAILSITLSVIPAHYKMQLDVYLKEFVCNLFIGKFAGISVIIIFIIAALILKSLFNFYKRLNITAILEEEKAYLEAFKKDYKEQETVNRWQDKFYVDVNTELQEKKPIYDIPPTFCFIQSLKGNEKKQDFNNLSNKEKIESSGWKMFRSLEKALLNSDENSIVVIAPPGSGKTVSLRNMAIKTAQRRLNQKINQIPIFINLGLYTAFNSHGDPQDFDIFLEEYFSQSGYLKFLYNRHWEKLLEKDRCIFFLDGLDEMPRRADDYPKRTKKIEEFVKRWKNTQFVLSCRELDYEKNLSFQQVLIKPFGRRQIKAFIKKYFKNISTISGRWEILNRIEENPSINTLCDNPFYLNMVCYYIKHKRYVPENKIQLYHLIIERLITRESIRNDIYNTEKFTQNFIDALSHLASYLAFNSKTMSIDYDEYVSMLIDNPDKDIYLDMIQYACKGGLLALNKSSRIIYFTHRRFLEFFSSYYLLTRYKNDNSILPSEFFSDLWWKETALFIAGIESEPSYFINLILSEKERFSHKNKNIEDLLKLDMMILTFECIYNSLEFQDQLLHNKIRDYLIDYYQHANILEKTKILSALSLDDSEESIKCIENALDDKSNWVSERAFFVITEGALRLQMRPAKILKEIWRFFINGRIFATIKPILKASRRSSLIRIFLPVYIFIVLTNFICVGLVLYVFWSYFSFIAFDLKIRLSEECLGCIAIITFATAITFYCLSRDEYPWLKRFIYTTPISLMGLYLTFHIPKNFTIKAIGFLSGYGLLAVKKKYIEPEKKISHIQSITIVLSSLFIASFFYNSYFRGLKKITNHFDFIKLPFSIPNYISMSFIIVLIILAIVILSVIVIIEIMTIRKLKLYRQILGEVLKSCHQDSNYKYLEVMFVTLKSYEWAQKILLNDLIEKLSKDLNFDNEDKIIFLFKFSEHFKSSALEDAIFQRIDNEENSYRRSLSKQN